MRDTKFLRLMELRDKLYFKLNRAARYTPVFNITTKRIDAIQAEIVKFCRCETCRDSDDPCLMDCSGHNDGDMCAGCGNWFEEQADNEFSFQVSRGAV